MLGGCNGRLRRPSYLLPEEGGGGGHVRRTHGNAGSQTNDGCSCSRLSRNSREAGAARSQRTELTHYRQRSIGPAGMERDQATRSDVGVSRSGRNTIVATEWRRKAAIPKLPHRHRSCLVSDPPTKSPGVNRGSQVAGPQNQNSYGSFAASARPSVLISVSTWGSQVS